jgi:hypothetical protein
MFDIHVAGRADPYGVKNADLAAFSARDKLMEVPVIPSGEPATISTQTVSRFVNLISDDSYRVNSWIGCYVVAVTEIKAHRGFNRSEDADRLIVVI